MVVDDIVVVGAKPLFMTDYIACGKVVPERIADIVARHRARPARPPAPRWSAARPPSTPACSAPTTTTSPGAATGVVEADALLGADRVRDGDVVIALASSGLHSNGYSLVRHILAQRGIALHRPVGRPRRHRRRGAARADPRSTRRRCSALLDAASAAPSTRSATSPAAASPPTSPGCCRVGSWVEVDRSTWSPRARVPRAERPGRHDARERRGHLESRHRHVRGRGGGCRGRRRSPPLSAPASPPGRSGSVTTGATDLDGFEQGAKGVDGGAVRLVGSYRE